VDGGFDASLAAETARRAGARTMLAGQVIQSGDHLLLTVELVDVESGNTLGSFKKEAASSTELFAMAGALAADVRDRLGVEAKASAGESFALAQSLTDSPEAYRQYVIGEVAFHQGNYSEAVNRFRLAIKQDSTFALAWYRLSFAHGWDMDSEAALVASTRSLEYLGRLPERWQVMCKAKNDMDKGDIDAAYQAMSEMITTTTDIPDAYYILGEVIYHSNRYLDLRKAITCFQRAIEIDPTFKIVFEHLIEELAISDAEAAERLVARYKAEDPLDELVVKAENTILFHQHKYDELIARVEAQMRRGNTSGQGYMVQALAQLGEWDRAFTLVDDRVRNGDRSAIGMRGQLHYARGQFRAALADYRETKSHLSRAYLLWLTGDMSGALAAALEAKERPGTRNHFDPRPYFWVGFFSLEAGRRREAEDVLNELKAMSEESVSLHPDYYVYLLRAEMLRADGNLDAALTELERESAMRLRNIQGMAYWAANDAGPMVRARVLEARGDRAGAIAAYQDVLNPQNLSRSGGWAPRTVPMHYDLGRLLESEGDLAAAREHYRTYVDRWGDADIPIPNVETAKARLKALEPR
jgi:tetratricopeptide (TPR) repeat protein